MRRAFAILAGCGTQIVYVYPDATLDSPVEDASPCGTLPEDAGHVSCCNGELCRGFCRDGSCECADLHYASLDSARSSCPPNQQCCTYRLTPPPAIYECQPDCRFEGEPFDGGFACFGDAAPAPDASAKEQLSCCDGVICRGVCFLYYDPTPHLGCNCMGVMGGCDPDAVCCVSFNGPTWGCKSPTACK